MAGEPLLPPARWPCMSLCMNEFSGGLRENAGRCAALRNFRQQKRRACHITDAASSLPFLASIQAASDISWLRWRDAAVVF